MAEAIRGCGDAGGCCSVHVAPSHVHVSPSALPFRSAPPKSTIVVPSAAIMCRLRAGGDVGGCAAVAGGDRHIIVSDATTYATLHVVVVGAL